MHATDGDERFYEGLLSGPCQACSETIPDGRIRCPRCGTRRDFDPEEYSRLRRHAETGLAGDWKPSVEPADVAGHPTDPTLIVPSTPYHVGLCAVGLEGADLRGLDLSGADLSAACLDGADLSGARLHGTILTWANLEGTNLSGADLTGAILCLASLRGADLSHARLPEADLTDADLTDVELGGAVIDDTFVNEAMLPAAG